MIGNYPIAWAILAVISVSGFLALYVLISYFVGYAVRLERRTKQPNNKGGIGA